MTFQAVEGAVIALLATVAPLSWDQVGRSDATMLDAGYESFVVTRYAAFAQEDHAAGGCKLQTWDLDCELHVKWTDDAQVQADLTTLRQNIIDRVGVKPTLDGESYWADVVSGAQVPDEVEVGSVKYQREVLRLRVQEHVEYVFEE